MRKLLLCGYMGSGKSTVAKLLSQKLQTECFDLDDLIEEKAQMSIKEIFETKGEVFFRKLEHEVFRGKMQSEEGFILALGGGTPAYANNHLLLNGEGVKSFYLKASIDTIYERLIHEHHERPLIAGKAPDEIREIIAKHLFDRNYYYLQSSHVITIDAKSVEEIALEIIGKLT
ncbi:MAG: shikimate kinase [Flavobacterium sp.]|uniref:shikimate kinase n=1 Tax=Flavobacterium sp. TaxID=239 RepID=UPI001206D56F|nr:shikimate kinase [Flavobacterium sp.]RZJ64320.1 MAG: shikimate kinase [Flavobacterium sp.]